MKLRSAPASPFGRKVKLVAILLGLGDRITIENAATSDPTDTLRFQNPLGKIPVLVRDDGSALYDSRVICEYLNELAGGDLYPDGIEQRYLTLTQQALSDGIMDAAILQVYEKRFRPEQNRDANWVAYQAEKVERALNALETDPPVHGGPITIADVTLACALGYLDFRFDGDWRADRPSLVKWFDDFQTAVPAFAETTPRDA